MAAEPTSVIRFAEHPPARCCSEGERAVLRAQARRQGRVDQEALDLRSAHQKGFQLKQRSMSHAYIDEFVSCYRPEKRNKRTPLWNEERSPEALRRVFAYEELLARDKRGRVGRAGVGEDELARILRRTCVGQR